jgi:hypothetical protein
MVKVNDDSLEKQPLVTNVPAQRRRRSSPLLEIACVYLFCVALKVTNSIEPLGHRSRSLCPAQHWAVPAHDSRLDDMLPALKTEAYRNLSVSLLSESIQIDTQVFDDSGTVANDPRFERFQKFIDFLDARFPALHAAVKHEPVNTYARLYTWQGADPSLKPALLMAHADTVPATEAVSHEWKLSEG